MKDLLNLFSDPGQGEAAATEFDVNATSVEELQREYLEQVGTLLVDGGVQADCVQIEIRHVGHLANGKLVFLGMLRLNKWERRSALRLMIGLPLLERLLRRTLRGTWLAEVSHFGGLWLHPSGQMVDGDVMRELRDVMNLVESGSAAPVGRDSMWSVPAELESSVAPLSPTSAA